MEPPEPPEERHQVHELEALGSAELLRVEQPRELHEDALAENGVGVAWAGTIATA